MPRDSWIMTKTPGWHSSWSDRSSAVRFYDGWIRELTGRFTDYNSCVCSLCLRSSMSVTAVISCYSLSGEVTLTGKRLPDYVSLGGAYMPPKSISNHQTSVDVKVWDEPFMAWFTPHLGFYWGDECRLRGAVPFLIRSRFPEQPWWSCFSFCMDSHCWANKLHVNVISLFCSSL